MMVQRSMRWICATSGKKNVKDGNDHSLKTPQAQPSPAASVDVSVTQGLGNTATRRAVGTVVSFLAVFRDVT